MQHNAEFAPGWLRAQIRDSIEQLKTDPRFSHQIQSFCETEKQVSHSSLFRRAEDVAEMETRSAAADSNRITGT